MPNLPNPWLGTGAGVLLRIVWLVLKSFTLTERLLASGTWDERLDAYVKMMTRYRHPGYRSFLIGSGDNARLRYNLSSFDALGLWVRMTLNRGLGLRRFEKLVTDHSIGAYVEKLKTHAIGRNPAAAAADGNNPTD